MSSCPVAVSLLCAVSAWEGEAATLEAFAAGAPGAVESGRARARAVTLREAAATVLAAAVRCPSCGEGGGEHAEPVALGRVAGF